MKKVYLSLLISILFAFQTQAQKFEWLYANTTNNNNLGYDNPKVKTDPWGNTFIMGRYQGWMVNGTDSMLSFGSAASFFLTKLDPAGNWLWSKTFSPHNASIEDMCIDGNGYVYATIYCYIDITYDDGDTSFVFPNIVTLNKIVSFDNNGKVRWGIEHPMGGSWQPLAASLQASGFYTAGGNKVCKVDTSGNIIWTKTASSSDIYFSGLECNDNGTLAVSGTSYWSGGTFTFDTVSFTIVNPIVGSSTDMAFFRMDTSGSVHWAHVLPNLVNGSTYTLQMEMLVNSASEIYILYHKPNGVLNYVFANDTVFNPYCPTCICGAVLKLSPNGTPMWASGAVYGDTHISVVDFILNDNEDIIITGSAGNTTYFGNNVFNNFYGLSYYGTFYAAKVLANGNYSWFKSDSRIIGQLVYDTPYGIAKGLNNTYTVMGTRLIGLAPAFQLGCLSDSNPNEGFFAVNISEGTEPLPAADFEYTVTGSMLMAHRPDEPNVTYSWNYGDGSPVSAHVKTLHQYAQPGVYNLCLSATNNCGTNTHCEQVNYAGIRTIISNKGGQGAVIDVNVYGGGFTSATTFKLKKSGSPDIIPVRDTVLSSGQLWGRLDLRNVALGVYDVEVTGPAGGPFVLANAFTVEPLRPAFISVTASSNRASRVNTWHKSTVTLTNEGNENALMVPLFIEFPIDLDFFYFGSPIDRHSIQGIQQGNDSIDLAGWFHLDKIAAADSQFYIKRISQIIPHILPGQSLSFDFYMKSSVSAEIRRMVQVRQPLFPSAALLDNTVESHDSSAHVFMYKTSRNWYGLPIDSVLYIQTLKNVLRQYANTFASYITGNGGVGSNGGPVGGMNTVGGGGYSGFVSGRQPSGSPLQSPKILPVVIIGCSSCCSGSNCSALPPPAANFPPPTSCASNGCCTGCNTPPSGFGGKPRTPYNPPPGGGCYPCPSGDLDGILFWANSFDPNAKYGPQRNGDIYLNDIQNKSYTITFENLSTATAPAQTVIVIDTLDAVRFDFSSFRFGTISIGDSLFVTLEENNFKQLHVTNLNPLINLWVAIEASFDTLTGIVRWEFTSIDPATKTIPSNPLIGFLPPNIIQNEGNGSVSFICDYKSSVLTGDSILNHAIIYFDNNAPIVTNDYINILDFTPPVSSINALPPTVTNDTILLTISGSDNLSGIAYYEVFVSANNGPFESFGMFNTNVIEFIGIIGNQYKFYSIATDRAGNVEDAPFDPANNPDAVTTVVVGIEENMQNGMLTLYPNPVKDELMVFGKDLSGNIRIMDALGRTVYSDEIKTGVSSFRINTSALHEGVYVIELHSDKARMISKFVKQ